MINTRKKHRQAGFTIIEVVLVLAVASLIFVVIFIAIPQLQQTRRNTHRKVQAQLVFAALLEYRLNNGFYPAIAGETNTYAFKDADFIDRYGLDSEDFIDPTTGNIFKINTGPSIGGLGEIDWLAGGSCDGEVFSSGDGSNSRNPTWLGAKIDGNDKIALVITLEPYKNVPYSSGKSYWLPQDGGLPNGVNWCIDNS